MNTNFGQYVQPRGDFAKCKQAEAVSDKSTGGADPCPDLFLIFHSIETGK